MTLKTALKVWKDAKPLLLMDTGVSDVLRKLPAPLDFVDFAVLDEVVGDLTKKLADKKIAKEKKAVAGIEKIQEGIKLDKKQIASRRTDVVNHIKAIVKTAKAYHANVEKGKLTVKAVSAFESDAEAKKIAVISSDGQDQSAVRKKEVDKVKESYQTMISNRKSMVIMLEDKLGNQPKRSDEEFARDYKKEWKEFGEEMAKLELAWKKIESY